MLNWIVGNGSVFDIETVLTLNWTVFAWFTGWFEKELFLTWKLYLSLIDFFFIEMFGYLTVGKQNIYLY